MTQLSSGHSPSVLAETDRTKKDRSIDLQSVFHECTPGRRKLAVKVVDVFGNDIMTIVEVQV